MKALRDLRDEYLRLDPSRLQRERKEVADREMAEQLAAQVAVVSAQYALSSIGQALQNSLDNRKAKPKTKYEYNQERRRDFRMNKPIKQIEKKFDFSIPNAVEKDSADASPFMQVETDPSPFVRNYQQRVFQLSLKQIHRKFESFHRIQRLDLSEQALGDEGIDKLCSAMHGCPIQVLNLSGNKISDSGMLRLAQTLRSLGQLRSLNLSWNEFTDKGFAHITNKDYFAPTLHELDLSFNSLTAESAHYLGQFFSPSIQGTLSVLRLGGKSGFHNACWGDRFLRVFLAILLNNNIQQLRELHVPDFGLTDVGIEGIISMLCSDKVNLAVLNISKNFIRRISTRRVLLAAVKTTNNDLDFRATDCGFTQKFLVEFQQQLFQEPRAVRVRWLPHTLQIILAQTAIKSIYESRAEYLKLQKESLIGLGRKEAEAPLAWKAFSLNYDSDLFSNIDSLLTNCSSFLDNIVRQGLAKLNREIAYVHKLQEVLATVKNNEMPKSASKAQQRALSAKLPKSASSKTDRLTLRITANHNEILLTDTESSHRLRLWTESIQNLIEVCREIMSDIERKLDKNRHRNAQFITPQQEDSIQFALEDCYSHSIEKGVCDQNLIGLYCEQKMLRFSEVQRALATSKLKNKEFEEFIYLSVPCCKTLFLTAFFSYYSFLRFPKESNQSIHNLPHLSARAEYQEAAPNQKNNSEL